MLNSVFAGRIKILPQNYNVNSLVYIFDYAESMKLRKPYKFSYSEEEYYDARKNPIITHYTGNFYVHRRPWIENSDHPHKDAYLKYRAMSPWRDMPMAADERPSRTKLYTQLCKILPRKIMLCLVSLLYNYIRPMALKRKIKKQRNM